MTDKNNNPYQKVLEDMEKKITTSYEKLKKNMLNNADLETIKQNTHELLLLLGETNYLAKECKRIVKENKQ